MTENEKQMDLVEPSPNPFVDRGYEQSMYLYYIACRADKLISLFQNQFALGAPQDSLSLPKAEENSIVTHAELM